MKFNDTAGRLGLVQDARRLCGLEITDTSSYTIHEMTTNINHWYRRANAWIWEASGTWEYDDRNYTDLPIATTNLVANQQDYEMPVYAQKIMRVEAKDSNGDWRQLSQFDQSEITGALTEFLEDAGMPMYYDVIGRSLFLYPKPAAADVTTTSGLKAYFSRDISEFTVNSTDTEPGFVDNFHRLLSLGAAQDWVLGSSDPQDYYKLDRLKAQINEMKEEINKFYGYRNIAAKKHKINASGEGAFDL